MAKEYISDGQEFANSMREDWARVDYNPETGEGVAHMGIGAVHFHESACDPAVVVTVPRLQMKGTPEQIKEALEKIAEIVHSTGL